MSETYRLVERDHTARLIREAYKRKKTAVLKRPYKCSPRHDAFHLWQAAADLAASLEVDPDIFVEAAFEQCPMKDGPFPNALGGPAMRGWYTRYRGRLPEAVQVEVPVVSCGPEPVTTYLSRPSTTAELDLSTDVELGYISLRHATGSMDPTTEEAKAFVRSPFSPILPYVRALMLFPDEGVRREFRDQILAQFAHRPSLLKAGEALGYPMQKIHLWLHGK